MTLRSEIEALFDDATKRIQARTLPTGIMRSSSDPDPRMVAINEINTAIHQALFKLADRLDDLESQAQGLE